MSTTDESGSGLAAPVTYVFGPEGIEVQSILAKPPSPPPPVPERAITRPLLPKISTRCQPLTLPPLQTQPGDIPITTWQGLQLYRLCDAVPYLLGSVSVVARLQMIIENDLDKIYKPPAELQSFPIDMTCNRNGAMLAILLALQKSEAERLEQGIWVAQGLNAELDALRLYKDRRPRSPESSRVNLQSFIAMAVAWQEAPNPVNTSCDRPDAKTPWPDIAAKLRELGVSVSMVNKDLYNQLILAEPEHLEQELARVKEWSDNGELERRHNAWQRQKAASLRPTSPSTTLSTSANSVLYAKRFSHEHPLGITSAKLCELEKAEEGRHRNARPSVIKEEEQPAAKKQGVIQAAWTKVVKKSSILARMMFILLVFLALMGGILYGMSSANTSDFTKPDA